MAPFDSDGDGLGMAPRPREPESALLPGMAAPAAPGAVLGDPEPRFGQFGHVQLGSMPDTSGPPPVATETPIHWDYDFDPVTGTARATFPGIVNGGGGGGAAIATTTNTTTLATVPGTPGIPLVQTLGFATPGDSGGGTWEFFAGDVTAADGWLVIQPTVGPAGRWKRQVVGAVRPQWAGAGIGAADDSVQFQKVLNNYLGAAIDASGATLKIKNLAVLPGNLCPGIYSDGTGTLTGPAGVVYTDMGVTVTKLTPFYFRNLIITMAVSTNPVVPPAGQNRMIWFANNDDTQEADGWEVTGCRSTGGQSAIVMAGRVKNARMVGNWITGTFGDGISGPGVGDGAFITDNTIIDSCYATGAPQPAGAIRIGSSSSAHPGQNITIARNHIIRCSVPADQSAIDCFSDALYDLNVHDNIIEDCGGGIELKTIPSPAGADLEIYGVFNVSNNMLRQLPKANSPGITIFHAGANDPEGKCARVLVDANHITCKTRALTGQGVSGITVSGYTDVAITNNFLKDLNTGITINGAGVASNTGYRTYVSGNSIDVVTAALSMASAGTSSNQVYIVANPMLKSQVSAALSFSAGTINDLYVLGNYIWGVNGAACDLRGINRGLFRDNVITGGTSPVVFQGTVSNNVVFESNRLATTYDTIPAVSGTVTNPGAGLTDGVRYFTVTNGTGTSPCIFSCIVTGGIITGPVVIVQPGMYSVFPGVPTVTVDQGIVGGATFTLTGAVANIFFSIAAGSTGLVIQNNSVDVGASGRTSFAAPAALFANNVRGTVSADPSATWAGSVGDVLLNSDPTTGILQWYCRVQGGVGAAQWVAEPPTMRNTQLSLGADVNLNNTANYFNGPTTGSLSPGTYLIYATAILSVAAGGPDFYNVQLWNGAAIVGNEAIISGAAGINEAVSVMAIVGIAAATTFTLRAKDVTSVNGKLLATGTVIGFIRLG